MNKIKVIKIKIVFGMGQSFSIIDDEKILNKCYYKSDFNNIMVLTLHMKTLKRRINCNDFLEFGDLNNEDKNIILAVVDLIETNNVIKNIYTNVKRFIFVDSRPIFILVNDTSDKNSDVIIDLKFCKRLINQISLSPKSNEQY